MKQSKSTCWRNRLAWLVIASVLVSLPVSVIFACEADKSTLDTQTPLSISSYLRDYAILSAPVRIDGKSYRVKGNENYTTRLIPVENTTVAYFLLQGLSPFTPSLCRISTSFANIDATSPNWSGYACKLLDLPPPPPAKFVELI